MHPAEAICGRLGLLGRGCSRGEVPGGASSRACWVRNRWMARGGSDRSRNLAAGPGVLICDGHAPPPSGEVVRTDGRRATRSAPGHVFDWNRLDSAQHSSRSVATTNPYRRLDEHVHTVKFRTRDVTHAWCDVDPRRSTERNERSCARSSEGDAGSGSGTGPPSSTRPDLCYRVAVARTPRSGAAGGRRPR